MIQLVRMGWASTDPLPTKWGEVYVGVIWFVIALFWAKLSLYYMSKWPKLVLPISFAISIATLLFRHYITKMVPWCILNGFVALPFVAVGWWQKSYGFPKWIKVVAVAVWPIAIALSKIEMYGCEMTYYPLSFVGACGGTIVVYYLSIWISKAKHVSLILGYVGIISLAIVCAHEIIGWSEIANTLFIHSPWASLRDNYYIFVSVNYTLIIGLALLVSKIPFLKKIYV